MQLFSKRNKKIEPITFIKETLRFRLIREIEYITSTNEFLERCFLVEDEKKSKWFLDNESLKNLSICELGYDITDFFDFKDFSFVNDSYDDYVIFDLLEIILIFSKEDQRKFVRERFQKHFIEEGNEYLVHDFLITQKNSAGVKPYVSFLKDKILKDKFEQYYLLSGSKNYEMLAKISAEILQFLFSAEKKKKTKDFAPKLIKELAQKTVEKKNIKTFSELLNKVVLNAKSLNNEISNIRHTDKSTLLLDNPSIFKLIVSNNICLSEYVIFANPEDYFFSQKAFDVKNEYITKYKIPVSGWVIRKPKIEEIDPDDIPF